MNPWLTVITLIILLLGFFSSDISHHDMLTGTAIHNSDDIFTDSFYFRAWKTTGISHGSGSRGEGVVTFELPREPESCTLNTRWETDNKLFASLGRPQLSCHKAQGTTTGTVDVREQSAVSDPGLFRWAGGTEPQVDPTPYRIDDYIFHAWTCDHLYYTTKGKRYYARAYIPNFGSKTLELHWEYYNDDTLPALDVFADLTCQLKTEKKPVAKKVTLSSPQLEEPAVVPQAFDVDVEALEPVVIEQPRGWSRFTQWLGRIFF